MNSGFHVKQLPLGVIALALSLSQPRCIHAAADISAAAAPLAEGVPQAAVVRLRELLQRELSQTERREAMAKLAEALIAAHQPGEALGVLADRVMAEAPQRTFLQAQAHAALDEWSEALTLYRKCVSAMPSVFHDEATVGEAEALRALGRTDEALQALSALAADSRFSVRARLRMVELLFQKGDVATAMPLLKSIQPKSLGERKQRRFLDGCNALHHNDPKRAIESLTSILKAPQGATRPVIVATLFALADASLRAGEPSVGTDALESFIENYGSDSALSLIFAKLDELYAAEQQPSRHELGRWSNDGQQPRRGFALWYLARTELRLGRRDLAIAAFRQLRADRPELPVFAEAFLEHAELELDDGRPAEALTALQVARELHPAPSLVARIAFQTGRTQFAAERYDVAAQAFEQIASAQPSIAPDAIHNASLAWLQANNRERFAADTQRAEPNSRGELMLEEALAEAAKGNVGAATMLQNFVRDFPQHARIADALVVLAELAFHAAPPRNDEARQMLARATSSRPSDAAAERADYLAIWVEDAAGPNNDEKVIALANEFLQKRGTSPLLPEVRLKLAEAYYRRQDFASAQTQFEILARLNPESAEAEKAQFFAAQSAMQSMGAGALDRALTLFDAVVKRDGDLKWAARNEQAVIERKLGKPQDALTLYDGVTRSDAKPPEKREALCGKADILYELGGSDAENYRRAVVLYDQLAAEKDVPAHWRNQALFKKGVCLEKLQAPADALATFYRIVEDENRNERQREYFWFYKAGFNAARLLEEQDQWQPAAAIYEKLAFAGGERSEEAKSRLNRLRLEHFLWEQ